MRAVPAKRVKTSRVTTTQLGTPSVNSRNFAGTNGMAIAPSFVSRTELAHFGDYELFPPTKGAGLLPFQGNCK